MTKLTPVEALETKALSTVYSLYVIYLTSVSKHHLKVNLVISVRL